MINNYCIIIIYKKKKKFIKKYKKERFEKIMDNNLTKKRKWKWQMPTSYTIILLLMFVFILLSWILQWAGVTTNITESVEVPVDSAGEDGIKTIAGNNNISISLNETVTTSKELKGLGLLDVMTAIWYGFKDKADVILFILALGGLLGVMTRIRSIDAGIASIVKKLKGKEILIIPVLMMIFGLGGTTYGMWEETIAFFPILIPVFIKMGYGAFVAVLTILVGSGVGVMASTINPFAVGVAAGEAGVSQGTMQGTRWITWVIFMAIAIAFVMWIAIRTKKGKFDLRGIDESKITNKFQKEGIVKFTVRRKISLVLFSIGFLIMILAYLPWYDWLGADTLATSTENADKNIYWLARSSMWEGGWGNWWFVSIAGVFTLITILVFLINHNDFVEKDDNKEKVFINTYMDGVKDLIPVCILIAIAGGLGKILNESLIGTWIANSSESLKDIGVIGFAVVIFFLSLVLSFFVPSTSGFAGAFIGIFAGIAAKAFPTNTTAVYGLIIMAFILASGIINLISPTSASLMAYTSYAEIPYGFWVKKVGPFVAVMTVVSLIFIVIFAAIADAGTVF